MALTEKGATNELANITQVIDTLNGVAGTSVGSNFFAANPPSALASAVTLPAAGSKLTGGPLQALVQDGGQQVYNIKHPDVNGGATALGDGRSVTDGAITTGTKAFTSATLALTQADVGKLICIAGAGAAGVLFIDTIAFVQSATACTTTNNAGTTVSGATVWVGSDNQTAYANAKTYIAARGGGILLLGQGKWLYNNAGYIDQNFITVAGVGEGITTLMPVGAFAGIWFNTTTDSLATDLTVDGSNQATGASIYGIRHDNGARLRLVSVEVKKTWSDGIHYTACTDIGISLPFVHNCGDNNPAGGAGANGIDLQACNRAAIVGPIVEDCTRPFVHGIAIEASTAAGSTDVAVTGYVCKNMGVGAGGSGAGAFSATSSATNVAIRSKRISVSGMTVLQTTNDSVVWINADEFTGSAWIIEGGGNGIEVQDCVSGTLSAVLTYNTLTEGFIIHNGPGGGTYDLVGINRWALSGCMSDTVTTLSRNGFHIKEDTAVMSTTVRGVNLSGCFARLAHGAGFLWEAMHGDSVQSGCEALDNNTGLGGHAGIEVYGITANGQNCAGLQITGGRSGETRVGGSRTQDKGLWIRNQADQVFASGVNVRNNATTNVVVDATCGSGVEVHQCPGWNPIGGSAAITLTTTVAVPALPWDRFIYITNGASVLTAVVTGVGGGNVSVVIPVSGWGGVFVPAGQTLTPTMTGTATGVAYAN